MGLIKGAKRSYGPREWEKKRERANELQRLDDERAQTYIRKKCCRRVRI